MGLNRDELEILATMKEPCLKTSRRDFPYVLAKVHCKFNSDFYLMEINNSPLFFIPTAETEWRHHCFWDHVSCSQGWYSNFCHRYYTFCISTY